MLNFFIGLSSLFSLSLQKHRQKCNKGLICAEISNFGRHRIDFRSAHCDAIGKGVCLVRNVGGEGRLGLEGLPHLLACERVGLHLPLKIGRYLEDKTSLVDIRVLPPRYISRILMYEPGFPGTCPLSISTLSFVSISYTTTPRMSVTVWPI